MDRGLSATLDLRFDRLAANCGKGILRSCWRARALDEMFAGYQFHKVRR
ncbi:MAG: hypothetical protein H7A53_11990 [Akkermansiaceae bacterium]|nr:hypothetical protein [Akkermansiaceae bacterium]